MRVNAGLECSDDLVLHRAAVLNLDACKYGRLREKHPAELVKFGSILALG